VLGSEIRFRVPSEQSGGDVVLVGESAEDLFPADRVLGEVDRFGWPGAGLSRGELAEGTVRPAGVGSRYSVSTCRGWCSLTISTRSRTSRRRGADDLFADRVRSGRLRRAGQDPDALGGEHGVEGAVNWPARSLIRNLTEAPRCPRSIRKLRAACVARAPSGCAVMPARWTRRVPCSVTIRA